MKTDNTTRFASLLLIFFFLFNDLHASARAIMHWDQLNNIEPASSSTSLNRAFSKSSAQPDFTNNTKPSIPVNTPESPSSISSLEQFSIKAIEDGARIGLELNMPVNDPKDDIFNFILPEDFKSADWSAVYLNYELKGLKDGRGLAKSFNSKETFGERSLEKDDQWYEVSEKVNPADLQAGRNYLRFTIPNGLGVSAEIKGLKLDFQRRGDNSLQSPRLERVITEDPAYFRAIPAIEGVAAYRLREVEMPALPQGVINVTAGAKAYQPAPEVVAQAQQIGFKLNIGGMNSQRQLSELQVYYFDYNRNAWQGVAIDSIDTQGEIAFVPNKGQTQYFGALIKSPEMPEASAFAPTMIQDIEAANPAAGMNIMQPPGISRTGEAAISYPLQIPAGRKGMQPQLALSYNSDAGSSWVGYGWNIGIPSISVDTKWGVPTFDANNQSEMYLMNGEKLFEEGGNRANRTSYSRSTSSPTYFFVKQTGSYQLIERLGTDPTNYYWVVTDANGTKFTYGQYSTSYSYNLGNGDVTLSNSDALLTNSNGEVVKWWLTEIEDINGNTVVYAYDKVQLTDAQLYQDKPQLNSTVWVPKGIFYTGDGSSLGNYMVEFVTEDERVDAMINAKYGFKLLDDRRLKNVKVRFQKEGTTNYGHVLKTWEFFHTDESDGNTYQFKAMLTSLLEKRGNNEDDFYEHTFSYHGGSLDFETQEDDFKVVGVNTFNSSLLGKTADFMLHMVPQGGPLISKVFWPSSLGTNSTKSHDFSLSPGVGYSPKPASDQDKNFTINMKIGGTLANTRQKTAFRDFNGDGLPDLMQERDEGDGDRFYYFPTRRDASGNYYFGSGRNIDANELMHSSRSEFNIGFEAMADLILAKYSYGLNWNTTDTYTDVYLFDYNADGILDLVQNNSEDESYVYFGKLDGVGNLKFNRESTNSLSPTKQTGTRPTINDDYPEPKMGAEIVRVWEAPESGTISISGNASLTSFAQGPVEIAIQKNQDQPYLNGFQTISASAPTAINVSAFSVTKGDLIMFRVRSGETSFEDLVEWDPQITYTGGSNLLSQKDGAGNELLSTKASDGFLLSGGTSTVARGDKGVKIDWDDLFLNGYSDDVQFRIKVEAYDQTNTNDTAAFYRETFVNTVGSGNSKWIYADKYDFDALSGSTDLLDQLGNANPFAFLSSESNPEDFLVYISFGIYSTSNLKWTYLDWRPIVTISSEVCGGGEENDDYPTVNYRTYNYFSQTQEPVDLSSISDLSRVWPSFPSSSTIQAAFSGTTYSTMNAYLTVKSGESLVTKAVAVFNASSGSVNLYSTNAAGEPLTSLPTATAADGNFDFYPVETSVNDEVYIEWHTGYDELESILQATTLDLIDMATGSSQVSNLDHNIFIRDRSILNDHWLHWGRFMWNDNDRVSNNPIDPSEFKLPTMDIAMNNDFSDMEEDPSKEEIEMTFDRSEEPEVLFFPLVPVRGEIEFADRDYIEAATSYLPSAPEKLDRFAALNSHAAEYSVPGMVAPWLVSQSDIAIEAPSPDPVTDDMVRAIRAKGHSYTLGDNFSSGFSGVGHSTLDLELGQSRYINGSQFFSSSETLMTDFNGDGFPDIWQTDDVGIVLTDPRGGMESGVTTITSGHKNKSQTYQAASVSLGSTINHAKEHASTEDDKGGSQTPEVGHKNLGASVAKSLGHNSTDVEWIDINGDGLPDRLSKTTSPLELSVNYNLGTAIESDAHINGATGVISDSRYTNLSLSFTKNVDRELSSLDKDAVTDNLDAAETSSKSFQIGLGANRSSNHLEFFYVDLNGDGLVDAVAEEPLASVAKYRVYLNKGLSFSTTAIVLDDIPTYYGQSNSFSLSGSAAGTYSFPAFTVPPTGHAKISINGQYSYAYAAQLTKSSFADMNGDGYPDMLTTNEDEEIEVYHNKLGKALKLETVTNPLGGSFTLDYDVEGNKTGYRTAEITSHNSPSDEDVFWDMPNGKWVLSSLEIFDGYNILEGSTDVDGADYQRFTYNYDGGVHSRREREFLGFSRVEKKYEALELDHYQGMPLKPLTDPSYIGNESCFILDEQESKIRRYYTEVYFYESLKGNSLERRREFEYKKGVLLDQFSYLNYAVTQVWTNNDPGTGCYLVPSRIEQTDYSRHLISHQENRLNYYSVSQSHSNPSKVEQDINGDLVEADFSTIDEESSVFPAVMSTLTYVHPQIDTSEAFYTSPQNPVGLVQATFYNVEEYDEYFNILRYTRGAGNVADTYTPILIETIKYTKVEEFPSHVLVKINIGPAPENELYYDVSNPHGDATLIPGFKSGFDVYELEAPPGFETDTIFLPLNMLEEGCGFTPVVSEDYSSFPFTFRKVLNKEINVFEYNLNTAITADLIADMEYHSPNLAAGKTSVLKTHEIRMNSSTANPSRRTTTVIDVLGQISKIRNHLVTTASNAYAETQLKYNSFGQVTKVKGPANHLAQHFEMTYTYDTYQSKFITKVSNSFGEEVCNIYDENGVGLLLQTIDINGNPLRYVYDKFYRPKKIYSPKALSDVNPEPTIVFEYHPEGISPTIENFVENIPVAFTYHNINRNEEKSESYSAPGCQTLIPESALEPDITSIYPLETAVFIDGLGGNLQTKVTSSWQVNGVEAVNREVSGFVKKNIYGWSVTSYISHLERSSIGSSLDPLGELNLDFSDRVSHIQYDYLGRPQKSSLVQEGGPALNEHSNYEYYWTSLNSQYAFVNDVQAPDGVRTKSYTDQLGRQVQLDKYRGNNGGAMVIDETKFRYDPLGQLEEYTSPAQENCSYTYDEFGRVLTEDHPDRGITTYTYDKSGNLTDLENGDAQTIEMKYNFNRLVEKNYPETGNLNDVVYTYGTPSSTVNGAGRIVKVEQGNDFIEEQYEYDDMGNVIEEYKLIRLPQAGPQEFTTNFEYDEWGRVQEMTYPDGEVVSYGYNTMGDLSTMQANLGYSNSYFILKEALYDGYGNMKSYTYGNNAVNTLDYDQYTRRMVASALEINPTGGSTAMLLDKTYEYDFNGNITSISNAAPGYQVNSNLDRIGGVYSLDGLGYDDMNQWISGSLKYSRTENDVNGSLDQDMVMINSYKSAGRLNSKGIENGNAAGLHYDLDYEYYSSSKHQIEQINATYNSGSGHLGQYGFTYNGSGSIIKRSYSEEMEGSQLKDEETDFCWTEDQRLRGVLQTSFDDREPKNVLNSSAHYYAYDHTGNRILKANMFFGNVGVNSNQTLTVPLDAPTVYVNPYYITTHYEEVVLSSKHYYMGSQRIASNMISADFDHEAPLLEPIPAPEGRYGYTNSQAAIIEDILATLDCLSGEEELNIELGDMLFLPSIGEGITFTNDEGADLTAEELPAWLACSQSLYWAQEGGVNCSGLELLYFYHSDYLGSVEFVTDMRGEAYQFFLNTPWGENVENQFARNYTAFSSRFRFNGKEWDEETGNFYYGARYYDPKISVWLSVDPLAHEYQSLSSYTFTGNNPIMLVDPDGRKILWAQRSNGVDWIQNPFQRILDGVFNGAVEGVWEVDPNTRNNVTLNVSIREGAKLTEKQQVVYDYLKHLTTMDAEMKIDMIGPEGMTGLPDSWSEKSIVEDNFTSLCFDEDTYFSQLYVFHHFLVEQESLQVDGPISDYKGAHDKALLEGLKVFGYTYSEVFDDETGELQFLQFYNEKGDHLFKVGVISNGDEPVRYEIIE